MTTPETPDILQDRAAWLERAKTLSESLPFEGLLFEAASALGTVGLSTGITPDLPDAAQLLMALTMFAGRLGPLTLVLALAARARPLPYQPATEALRIG